MDEERREWAGGGGGGLSTKLHEGARRRKCSREDAEAAEKK
jgi:hypothetical protein